jgi:hypothetical protein
MTLLSAILQIDAAGISASISQLYCFEPHSVKQQSHLNHFIYSDKDSDNAIQNFGMTISHSLLLLLVALKLNKDSEISQEIQIIYSRVLYMNLWSVIWNTRDMQHCI